MLYGQSFCFFLKRERDWCTDGLTIRHAKEGIHLFFVSGGMMALSWCMQEFQGRTSVTGRLWAFKIRDTRFISITRRWKGNVKLLWKKLLIFIWKIVLTAAKQTRWFKIFSCGNPGFLLFQSKNWRARTCRYRRPIWLLFCSMFLYWWKKDDGGGSNAGKGSGNASSCPWLNWGCTTTFLIFLRKKHLTNLLFMCIL